MKKADGAKEARIGFHVTKPVSRVLSGAVIYLGDSSPNRSSRLCASSAEQTLR